MRKEEGQDAQDNEAVGSSGSNPLAPFWMYTTGGAEGAGGTDKTNRKGGSKP